MITISIFDDEWKRNRRRKPFDIFEIDENFDHIFTEMDHMIKRIFRDLDAGWLKPGSSFIHGYNIRFGPDSKPHIDQFGTLPSKKIDRKQLITEKREPLTDLIESDDEVSITIEIPGIKKQDIDLRVTENNLEINVDNPKRKYHKFIDLPCDAIPKTSKASYKNGILDIVIKRKEKKSDKDGFRVDIE